LQTPIATETKARTFEQRHLQVPRSARYAILGSLEADLSEVWIVCHGHGQLARRFLSRFLPLERPDRLIVAPEALSRYYLAAPKSEPHPPNTPVGASWMTSEDRDFEIHDYVNYLDLLHDQIFAIVGQVDPDRVVLWAGVLPPELDTESAGRLVRRSPLTIVVGLHDDFATPQRVSEQDARLQVLGVPYATMRFEGGHEISPEALMRLTETAG